MKPDARMLLCLARTALPAAALADVPGEALADRSELAADARGFAGLDVDNGRGRVVLQPSGSIDCRAALSGVTHVAHDLEGRIGPGGPAIQIQTVSGDLNVTSGGK